MTLTTEQIEQVIDDCRKGAAMRGLFNKWIVEEMASELLRCRDRLAELSAAANREAQPVQGLELAGWQFKSVNGDWLGILDELGKNQAVREGCEVREVYAMTDSPNDRDAVREAHAEWSRSTFGKVGPIGPLKHLSKEALEAAAQPDDLSEWADMQFLLWDAQRRAGITDEQITQAMIEKLKVNMARQWPEPKDGEPRLHITAPPAPAVPECFLTLLKHAGGMAMGTDWNSGSAAKHHRTKLCEAVEACHAAMLAQPVSSGYKLVPVEPTDEQLRLALAVKWPALYREHLRYPLNGPKSREENERQIAIAKRQYAAMLAAAPEGGNG